MADLKARLESLTDGTKALFQTAFNRISDLTSVVNGKVERASLSVLRASTPTTPPDTVFVVGGSRSAAYVYDISDTTSTDNNGTVLRTANNLVYKLTYPGKSIDAKLFGVVYGAGVSAGVQAANNTALQNALNSGIGIEISGIIEKTGTLTVTDKNIYLTGTGQYAIIRQMNDVHCLVINQTSASTESNIYDLAFEAGSAFTTSVAIVHNGYATPNNTSLTFYQKPFAHFQRVIVRGSDTYTSTTINNTFKKGFVFSVPNKVTVRDCYITGTWGLSNMNDTTGIELSTTRLAVESVFDNVVVCNMQTGIRAIKGSVSPGLEGVHISHSSIITCYDGLSLEGSSAYRTPGWFIDHCHFAVHRIGILFEDMNQGIITNNLVYHYGNSVAGQADTTCFLRLKRVSDVSVTGNKFYYQDISLTNDPNGILLEGGSTISEYAVGNFITGNYIALKGGVSKPAIWLQNYAQGNEVTGNRRAGGSTATVIANLPYDNVVRGNTPEDLADASVSAIKSGSGTDVGAVLTRVNASDPAQGYDLSVYHLRAGEVVIPAGLIESNSFIKTVTMRYGQTVTIRFADTTSVQHSTSLQLADARTLRFRENETLTIYRGSAVTEIGRKLIYTPWVAYDAGTGLSTTVDLGRTRVLTLVNSTASTLTVTIDMSKLDLGDKFVIKRIFSSGPITIQTNTSAQIEKQDGSLETSYSLPSTAGNRQFTYQFTPTGHLELIAN